MTAGVLGLVTFFTMPFDLIGTFLIAFGEGHVRSRAGGRNGRRKAGDDRVIRPRWAIGRTGDFSLERKPLTSDNTGCFYWVSLAPSEED